MLLEDNNTIAVSTLLLEPFMIKIVYHNARSLHLHIQELVHEKNMHASDIIGISENRHKDTDRNKDYQLPGFHIH